MGEVENNLRPLQNFSVFFATANENFSPICGKGALAHWKRSRFAFKSAPFRAFSPDFHASPRFLGVGHNKPLGAIQVVGDGLHSVLRMRFDLPHVPRRALWYHRRMASNVRSIRHRVLAALLLPVVHRRSAYDLVNLRGLGSLGSPPLRHDVEEGCCTRWLFHGAKLLKISNLHNAFGK